MEKLEADKRQWTVPELNILLKWKIGKIPPDITNKDAKIALWAREGPACCHWTWLDGRRGSQIAIIETTGHHCDYKAQKCTT